MLRNTISKLNNDNSKYKEISKGFRPPFYYETFEEFYNKCGFSIDEVSQVTRKSKKTIKRWHKTDAPEEIYWLIYACTGYMLSEAFYGFKIAENVLYTGTRITYNYGFTANEITEYSFHLDRLKKVVQDLEHEKLKYVDIQFQTM